MSNNKAPTTDLETGLDVFENMDAPWCDPDSATPVPSGARQAIAQAISSMGAALAGRQDSPAHFARSVRQALSQLADAGDVLKRDWPEST